MTQELTDIGAIEHAERLIRELLQVHTAWFLTLDSGAPIAIDKSEFDFSVAHRRLIFSSWTEKGSRTWRITAWEWNGEKLLLEVTRRMGGEVAKVELVPRASGRAIVAGIAAARQSRCEKLAQLVAEGVGGRVLGVENAEGVGQRVLGVGSTRSSIVQHSEVGQDLQNPDCADVQPTLNTQHPKPNTLPPKPNTQHPNARIERATLSPGMRRDQPGRYARIILRLPLERVAVTATVAQSDARNVDSLFSSALLWFMRLQSRPKRPPIERLLLLVEHDVLEATRQRHVLLRDSLRQRIEVFEIDEEWQKVERVLTYERRNLWQKRLARFPPIAEPETGDLARQIIAEAPQAIDAITSRHGQTLRYHGLPFARVRRVMEQDRVWFGIEGASRRTFHEHSKSDWEKLLGDLATYRNENCRDRRHWLYRAAGEAWLESILRRDVSKLDPGLIIAPLHAQFRTSHGGAFGISGGARPIDLLALRHDGRLVVIELKVSEDREHVFQGVDYWRRVEAHRRRGHISSAKLFGDREISDESPLVYLVAPTLRFHPSFTTLAKTIAPDIEIYRFDINEDWRAGVRVVRRERVNG